MLRTLVPNYAPRAVLRGGGPRHAIRGRNVHVTELFCGRTPAAVIELGDQHRTRPLGCRDCKRNAAEVGFE